MRGTIDIADIAGSQVIEPAILYFGTPVVLIGSANEDGSFNLAPMSSAWWVGWRCMLGLARNSRTTENMIRTGECDRDRGEPLGSAPPTPPYVRVRIRRFEKLR